MGIEDVLNKEEAEKVFKDHSIFMSGYDVFPLQTAAVLFGKEAVKFVPLRDEKQLYKNAFYIGGEKLEYLYRKGFEMLVTYHNAMMLLHSPAPKK